MSASQNTGSAANCDSIRELIPEYAFGLTSPEETRLIEANLANCPEAVAQLADYRGLQDEMRAGVPLLEPPPALEEKLMAAIAAPTETATPSRKIHLAWWVAAAATIALIVTNLYWLGRTAPSAPGRDDSAPVLVQGSDSSSFLLTSSREIRWVRLPPADQYADASAILLWNVESEIGLLYVRNFPELTAGKTFQLWLTRSDERISAGTFEVDENGTGALLFNIPEAIDDYAWAWITEEPASGSPQPGDSVVVVGEL